MKDKYITNYTDMSYKTYLCCIILALLLAMPSKVYGQSSDQNYIVTETMLNDNGSQSVKSIQYYDGLGRPSVLAAGGMNTTRKYVYSTTEYDTYGLESKVWLPAAGSTTPNIIDVQKMASLSSSTYTDSHAYSTNKLDVLGRSVFEGSPGDAWVGKGKKINYLTNEANSVIKYKLNSSGNPNTNIEYYGKGVLTGTLTIDEDSNSIEVYKDLLGNVVLERRNDGNKNLDTYYVYDKGFLKTVIPPLYQTKKETSLLYKYDYDGYGRCIKKTLPGNVVIKYWYDKYGRLSFMQDGKLLADRKFRFYLYDGLGRMALQGLTKDTVKKSNSTLYDAKVIYNNKATSIDNTGYYFEGSFTINSPEIEIANYYDDYKCLEKGRIWQYVTENTILTQNSRVPVIGCLTAQLIACSDKSWQYRVMFYDTYKRCTDTYVSYPDNVLLHTKNSYSFTNKLLSSSKHYYKSKAEFHTINNTFTYDSSSDLLKKEQLELDNNPIYTLYENTYNNLGQLQSTKVGNGNILSEKYSYNVHGWLKKYEFYNSKVTSSPVFQEELAYESGKNPCYNGNISSVRYKSPDNVSTIKGFDYTYDKMDRLVKSDYYDSNVSPGTLPTIEYSETFNYNENSSIAKITRYGKNYRNAHVLIDNISFKYDGNRLNRIDDSAGDMRSCPSEFRNSEENNVHYYYNTNGAMTKDYNRGIADIEYDYAAMPKRIQFMNGSINEYIYTADGIKLKTIHRTAVDGIHTYSKRELSTAETKYRDEICYIDGFELRNGDAGKYYYANGYLDCDNSGHYSYNFFAKDHLGNIRASYSLEGKLLQANNYYAFGGDLGDINNNSGDVQNHMYNGKELDRLHGLDWYDYSARQYDATIGQFTSMDPLCEKYYGISPYAYCLGNPLKYIDPDGNVVIPVHGTWSDPSTWKNLTGILNATNNLFGDNTLGHKFGWSGGNSPEQRTIAAERLVEQVRKELSSLDSSEPITLVGHSHGGNVCIEAINMMVDMDEFKGRTINLLTINTPVRDDYQLSENAQNRVSHVNVYDPKDPVQKNGGKTTIGGISVEIGTAGRVFENANNIKVDNPQGIINCRREKNTTQIPGMTYHNPIVIEGVGDFHNSHNRVQDWIKHTK